eukprot:363940-Chlamydomonas_euryale.AAC.15
MDMATAAFAWFGVLEAKAAGQPVPAGVAINAAGEDTVDPDEVRYPHPLLLSTTLSLLPPPQPPPTHTSPWRHMRLVLPHVQTIHPSPDPAIQQSSNMGYFRRTNKLLRRCDCADAAQSPS